MNTFKTAFAVVRYDNIGFLHVYVCLCVCVRICISGSLYVYVSDRFNVGIARARNTDFNNYDIVDLQGESFHRNANNCFAYFNFR